MPFCLPEANAMPVVAKIFLIFFFFFSYKYKFTYLVCSILVTQVLAFTIYNKKFLNASTFYKKIYSILKSIIVNI